LRENVVPHVGNKINRTSGIDLEENPSTLELSNAHLPNIVATHGNNHETNNDTRSPKNIINEESLDF